jgi:tetratricopeptide (TPR) repeat protein
LLLRAGRALRSTEGEGLELLVQALEGFRESGDEQGGAEAASEVGQLHWFRGARDEAYRYADRATDLISERPSSPAKAKVLLTRAGLHLVSGEFGEALRLAQESLSVIDELGLEARRPRALNLIGSARVADGDAEGLRDLEQAVEIGLEPPYEHLHSCFENLRSAQYALGRLADASATLRRHVDHAERLGIEARRWVQMLRAGDAFQRGYWEQALGLADDYLEQVDAGSPHYLEAPCRAVRAAIRICRGDSGGASRDADRALEAARQAKDAEVLAHGLGIQAMVALAQGRRDEADDLASELANLGIMSIFPLAFGWPTMAEVAWLMHDLDRRPELVAMIEAIPLETPWVTVAREIAHAEYVRAAGVLGEMGHLPAEADARLRAAEALARSGFGMEADAQMSRALDFYRAVDAKSCIRRAHALQSPRSRQDPHANVRNAPSDRAVR